MNSEPSTIIEPTSHKSQEKIPSRNVRVILENRTGYETSPRLRPLAIILGGILIIWVMLKKKTYGLLGLGTPLVNSLWFDGFGRICMESKKEASRWQALNIVYNQSIVPQGEGIGGVVDRFWWGQSVNGRAVRNRLKIAKRELKKEILARPEETVRVMSIAAGTAQGVIEVLAELKHGRKQVECLLVDIDPTALAYAKKLAETYGVADQITTVESSAQLACEIGHEFKPHIVKMMGLLDYLSQDEAVTIAESIRSYLAPDGAFMTCNIHSNLERHFMAWVINWPMIYRTCDELADVAVKAGFKRCVIFDEPLRIHGVLVARSKWEEDCGER